MLYNRYTVKLRYRYTCRALDLGHVSERKAVDEDGWTVDYLEFREVLPWESVERFIIHRVLETQRLKERISSRHRFSGRRTGLPIQAAYMEPVTEPEQRNLILTEPSCQVHK